MNAECVSPEGSTLPTCVRVRAGVNKSMSVQTARSRVQMNPKCIHTLVQASHCSWVAAPGVAWCSPAGQGVHCVPDEGGEERGNG